MDDERIMDIVAEWQVDYDKIKAKKSKGEEIEIWRFVFKVKLFLPYPKSDIASRDLYYIQAVHDVIDRRYPCNEQVGFELLFLSIDLPLLASPFTSLLPSAFVLCLVDLNSCSDTLLPLISTGLPRLGSPPAPG